MARLSMRLVLTGMAFGVLLGLLYSGGQAFLSQAHRALPSGAQRPRIGMRLRALVRGVPGVVERPEVATGETELVDHRLAVVARPEGAASATGTASHAEPEPQAGAAGAGAAAGEGAGGFVVTEAELEEYRSGRKALPRVCGSPAVDGYAHVKPECLEASPTNKLWWSMHPSGGKSGEGLECHVEHEVSLDGLAVGWGIGNKKATPEECCQACRDHVPGPAVGGPYGNLPCNVWVYCNAPVCYEADAHSHSQGDCWLKFSEAPQYVEVNARQAFTKEFRQRHPDAPPRCQWVSGILVPPGQTLTNGTWGPRFEW